MTTRNLGSELLYRPKILIMSTSATSTSFDARLTALVTKRLAAANAVLTVLNLTEYPLPFHAGLVDVAGYVPREVRALQKLALRQDSIFMVTRTRHGYLSELLVNAIAWLGAIEAEQRQPPMRRRPVFALAAASADAFGVDDLVAFNMRAMIEINLKAAFFSAVVGPLASQAFDEAGELRDRRAAAALENVTAQLVADSQCNAVWG